MFRSPLKVFNSPYTTDAYLVSSVALPSPSLSIASTDQPLAKSVPVGKQLQMYAAESLGAKLSDVQKVTLGNLTTQISTLWLVVRYVLQ